jgi:hypothetical protein
LPETQRLVDLAQQRLREGTLPVQADTTALGGRSNGSACELCGEPVAPGAAEIELVWSGDDGRRSAILHPACHAAWLVVSRTPNRPSN